MNEISLNFKVDIKKNDKNRFHKLCNLSACQTISIEVYRTIIILQSNKNTEHDRSNFVTSVRIHRRGSQIYF